MAFGIIVRNGTTGSQGHRSGHRKLSPSERADIQGKIDEARSQLSGGGDELNGIPLNHLLQSKTSMSMNLKKMEGMLDRDSELVAKGAEKDRIQSEIRQIDEVLAEHIPPMSVQKTNPKDESAFEKAVQAAMHASAPEVVDLANKRRDLKMRIEPDDPGASSLKEVVGE